MRNFHQRLLLSGLIGILTLVSCSLFRPTDHDTQEEQYQFAAEALEYFFIYRDKLPDDLYAYATPEELYEAVDEPYTHYYNRQSAARLFEQLTTTIKGGIGIRFDSCATGYWIENVVANSPGDKAGLQAGDTIVRVDNAATAGMVWLEFQNFLPGEVGSNVMLRVKRGAQFYNITVTRGTFLSPSVFIDSISPVTASILLGGFFEETSVPGGSAVEFSRALKQTAWAEHTIIDLRDNRGGRVDQCVSIISELLTEGMAIINYHERTLDPQTGESVELIKKYVATGPGTFAEREITILVNRNTASASEIMTSALMQRSGVTVIGDTTYGKARGQYIFEGPGSVAVTVTAMTFTLVNDSMQSYDLVGIVPDILTDTLDAFDVALGTIEGTVAAKRAVSSRTQPHTELSGRLRMPMAVIKQ